MVLCSTLLLGGAVAQHRGGGGGGGGGFHGSIGGGAHVGSMGSMGSFNRGGFGGVGVSNGFRGGIGVNRGIGYGGYGRYYYGGYGWPYYGYAYGYGLGLGYGYGYWPYYDYGDYYDYPYSYYPDGYSSSYYPAYQTSPNVTVVYPQAQPATSVYVDRASPVMREYDQYGQQLRPAGGGNESGSPIYLIALKNHNIYAAASYSVSGATLHYVTLEHAEKEVPLADLDRDMTLRLNGERHVQFQLPAQQ